MTIVADARENITRELRRISIVDPTTWVLPFAVITTQLLAMRQSFTVRASHGMTPMQLTIVVLIGVLVVLVATGRFQMPVIPRIPTLITVGAFCLIFISYSAAATRGLTAEQVLASDRTILLQVVMVAVYVLIITIVRTRESVMLVLRGVVLGAAISAMFAIVQTGTGKDLAPMFRIPVVLKADSTVLVTDLLRAGTIRPQGAAGHPLELSAVLTTAVPLALAVTLYSRSRAERLWPMWAGATGIILVAALSTVSRSAVVGLLVMAVVLGAFAPIKRTLTALGVVAAIVFVASALHVSIVARLAQVITSGSQDGSLESRSYGAGYASTHIAQHFWLGQGPGTYDLTKQPVLDNEYLTRMVEGGLVGAAALPLLLGLGIVAGLIAAVRAARVHHRVNTDIAACVLASIAIIAVTATVLDISGFAQVSTVLAILIPLAVVLSRQEPSDERI